ncbi:MAG: 50S ribosomal protein L23 [Planctomycetes bacterium]|nr:50S ribosomal protein L23 [Planctomycetota bacterium]
MKKFQDVIVRPLLSEKGMHGIETGNTYPFEVRTDANKIEIRNAVQEKFGVKVVGVRTMNMLGKARRQRWYQKGFTKDWKKALVTLKEGDRIEFV